MIAMVGYSGFVGSNIYARARNRIDGVFNSKNIEKAYGLEPEVLIYAGLRAEKYLANRAPYKDMKQILEAEKNIKKINPQKVVLISTIDVYKNPVGVDEENSVFASGKDKTGSVKGSEPYGLNRYYFEEWVRENFPDSLIIRLPAIYGLNIKRNFIYDFMNVIPFMLKKEKFEELEALEEKTDKKANDIKLADGYELLDNGFYRYKGLLGEQQELLKSKFRRLGFTALNFTDSRSRFQFYPLNRLYEDIQTALMENITLLNLATQPVSAGELYEYLTGDVFKNELEGTPANYDFITIHAEKFGGKNGYICSKEEILESIKRFVES